MKLFYADDTYAKEIKDDPFPRVNVFGGILIDKDFEPALLDIISEAKSKFTHPNLPIKWNFKDTLVKEKFDKFGRQEEYRLMLSQSNLWRKEIIERCSQIDYKIICGVVQSYSSDVKVVKRSKPELLKYAFENVLMRLGMDALDHQDQTIVILDWPPESNPQPFTEGYYRLFHQGKSSAGTALRSGKLADCKFFHTLLFAKCTHSPILQFTDLVLGAIKDYLEARFTNRQNLFAFEVFNLLQPKFRQSNGRVLGWGLIPPTGNTVFKEKLKHFIS